MLKPPLLPIYRVKASERWATILKRRGPVGQDRPKTVVAEDAEALKRIMFYHDWNPVEAGMVNHRPRFHPVPRPRFSLVPGSLSEYGTRRCSS